MNALFEGLSVEMQVAIWGAAYSGDLLDVAALIAEERSGKSVACYAHPWDRTAKDLAGIERWHGDEKVPVPEWWALPLVVDDVLGL